MNENPYERYKHVGFSAERFIEMARDYPMYFINYCEAVITENGLVFLASPSHGVIVDWLKRKRFRNCVEVWYNVAQCGGKITKSQGRVLEELHNAGLINEFAAYGLQDKRGMLERWL